MNFDINNNNDEIDDIDAIDEVEEKAPKKLINKKLLIYIGIGIVLFLILLIIILSATTKKAKQPVEVKEPVVIKKNSEEQRTLNIVDENSNERPVAIVIDNNIGDAKHAGLQDSYINYEMIVEGGLTRILAIYKDKDVGLVGPVRSARHYFLDYALEHDAIFGHFGWSPMAEEDITKLKVTNVNGMTSTSAFARDKSLQSPHNVFTSTKKIRDYIGNTTGSITSDNWNVFKYSNKEISLRSINIENNNEKTDNLIISEKIAINYSANEIRSYYYDTENKYYLRENNGKVELDRVTGNQLHYKNIIIMKVENKTIDKEGRQDLTTVGTGKGYYITDGLALPITWTKESRTSKTKYKYSDGTEIELNDGNTFIQIVPLSSKVTIGKDE